MGKDDHNPINKYKRKLKKTIGCGCGWFWFGAIFVAVGIVLLVYFGEFWNNDNEVHKRNVSYTGAALIAIGIVMLLISSLICTILVCIYKRQNAPKSTKVFTPPKFAPGEAPYPQQPPMEAMPQQPPANDPSAPPADSKVEMEEIKIEDNGKY